MKILIVDNPVVTGGSGDACAYHEAISLVAGQWIDVETEHLFEDQYNVKDLRIYEKYVKAILDDARIGRMKCRNCGATQVLANYCVNNCNHKFLHPFSQNKKFKTFVYKSLEGLFWSNKNGWVTSKSQASRFKLDDLLVINPPMMCSEVVPTRRYTHDH